MRRQGVVILQITEAQLDAITRDHFLRKLHGFLLERTRDAGLRALLAARADCLGFWSGIAGPMDALDEQQQAVRLSYALACRARGEPPTLPEPGEEGEIAMKGRLEAWGMLRFSDFAD